MLYTRLVTQTVKVQLRHQWQHQNQSRNLCPTAGCVCVFVALVLFLSTELVHLPFTFLKPPTPHFTDTISTSLIIRVKLPTVLFSPALDQSSFSDKGCLKLEIESTKEEQTNTLLCTV